MNLCETLTSEDKSPKAFSDFSWQCPVMPSSTKTFSPVNSSRIAAQQKFKYQLGHQEEIFFFPVTFAASIELQFSS